MAPFVLSILLILSVSFTTSGALHVSIPDKASGTTNSSVIQSFRKKPSATCSKQSAKYIGLRVRRYGPPRTIVNAGSAGFTFVPAFFIVTTADNASVGAKITSAIPQTRQAL